MNVRTFGRIYSYRVDGSVYVQPLYVSGRLREHELLGRVHAGNQLEGQLRQVQLHGDGIHVDGQHSPGNYVKFTIAAGAFTLTAVPGEADSTTRRAPVNGIQIVPSTSSSTAPRTISVNFVGSNATLTRTTEAAGVVSKSHWNSASAASRSTPLPLADETGSQGTPLWGGNETLRAPVNGIQIVPS